MTYRRKWRFENGFCFEDVTLLISISEFSQKNFPNIGYVVWHEPHTLYGSHSPLDRDDNSPNAPGTPAHSQASIRLDWVSVLPRSSYRGTSFSGVPSCPRTNPNYLKGMGIIGCLLYLCSFKSADWLGYPWQCIKQRHIMVTLAAELQACRIPFDAVKHRIRWVYHLLKYGLVFINHKSCFPHIVNLVCKAVLASITEHRDVFSNSNPVANIRALVTAVCLCTIWKLWNIFDTFFRFGHRHYGASTSMRLSRPCTRRSSSFFVMLIHVGHQPCWWLNVHLNLKQFVFNLFQ